MALRARQPFVGDPEHGQWRDPNDVAQDVADYLPPHPPSAGSIYGPEGDPDA